MSSKQFKSFVAALSVSFLTTIACNPIASSPTAVDRPVFTDAALPTAKSTPPVAPAQRDRTKAVSGVYGALLLGIGDDGELTGYYSNSTGAGQYNCDFYVRGKLKDGIAEITTWFPRDKEIIGGRLKFVEKNGMPGVNIKLAEEPGGCGMIDPELDDENGSTHLLDEPGEWHAVRVVSVAKSFFHSRPNGAAKQKAFAVEYDAVRVYKSQNGWVEAEFGNVCVESEYSQCKRTRGWLKETDLFSSKSPK